MDYKTKPISRKDLRAIARWFRHQFKCKNKFRFDVINAFERIHQLFPQITTEVVESESTDVITNLNVPAACNPDMNGGYHIAVREHVYEGACRGIGGYRAHILHEMCHAILCLLGFTPILDRAFNNNEIEPCYLSMEWQAKALCGELMIPYEKCKSLSLKQIMSRTNSSKEQAKYFMASIAKGVDDNEK